MTDNQKSEKDNIIVPRADESYSIVLPCEPEQFGDFISSLLGKPQTIEKSIHGVFEIEQQDVINTFHLVDQRIHQQNDSSLVQFTVKILYDDDSSITLNSLEDYERHTEIRPIASIGVVLSWTYLIKFKNKKAPEKQEITLSFRSDTNESGMYFADDGLVIRRSRLWFGRSGTFIRVDHTERTWGVDIESLLTGHVKTLFKSQAGKKKFIYKHSGEIGFITGMLFFLGAIAGVILSSSRFIASYLDKVHAIASETATATALLSTKLDFLIELISTGAWPRYIFSVIVFLIISFILSIFLGIWVSTQADNQPRSWILLSKTAKEKRTKHIDKHRRDWLMFSISIIVSVITGIASNIIFTKYFGIIG